MRTNDEWMRVITSIMRYGIGSMPRGKETKEVIGFVSFWDMTMPVISIRERKLGYRFMPAEAAWILSGMNTVADIAPYSKVISTFSDDGHFFFGAYGPKIREQLPYVIRQLKDDWFTRQAVINIWRESPMRSRDIPCTISLQFLVRDKKLHCVATMRSSDAWLGIPYDVFNFSMISTYLLLLLRENFHFSDLTLGTLQITAGSQHLYQDNWDAVERILNEPSSSFEVKPISTNEFESPQTLIDHLWAVAKQQPTPYYFLKELRDETK
jgi:thymidylate synthase